jgi:hypothetical protein
MINTAMEVLSIVSSGVLMWYNHTTGYNTQNLHSCVDHLLSRLIF